MKNGMLLMVVVSLLFISTAVLVSCGSEKTVVIPKKVRLARLIIDSIYLDEYKRLLKDGAQAAVEKEPGVLSLYAVFEKEKPTHLTILEMYADEEAYQFHIKTPHFQKYKEATLKMVKSLELVETDPLIPGLKIK